MKKILLFFIVTLSYNFGFCQQTLVVLGDSFSAAYGMKEEEGWVSLLETRLQTKAYTTTVINDSVSGYTTQNGLDALPDIIKDHAPDLLILSLGGNDGLRGMPAAHITSNLKSMIELCLKADIQVILVGVELPVNYGDFYRNQFRRIYINLSETFDLPLIPFLLKGIELDLKYFQNDRIHPTAQAQSYMLDQLWPTLEPLLEN